MSFSIPGSVPGAPYLNEIFSDYFASNSGGGLDVGDIIVCTTGNDTTGDGTLLAPYATLNKAITVVTDGGNIQVYPGTYLNSIPSATTTATVSFNLFLLPGTVISNTVDMGMTVTAGKTVSIYGRGQLTNTGIGSAINNVGGTSLGIRILGAASITTAFGDAITNVSIVENVTTISAFGGAVSCLNCPNGGLAILRNVTNLVSSSDCITAVANAGGTTIDNIGYATGKGKFYISTAAGGVKITINNSTIYAGSPDTGAINVLATDTLIISNSSIFNTVFPNISIAGGAFAYIYNSVLYCTGASTVDGTGTLGIANSSRNVGNGAGPLIVAFNVNSTVRSLKYKNLSFNFADQDTVNKLINIV